MTAARRGLLACILVGLAGTYLLVAGLDRAALWDDEAEVALIGRNWLRTGEFTAWDGRNVLAYQNGTTTDPQLITRQPPLMFVLAATGLRLLGDSAGAGRLPFALFGAATLWVLGWVLRRELPAAPATWAYGLAMLAFSCSFLLYARQCRYYG